MNERMIVMSTLDLNNSVMICYDGDETDVCNLCVFSVINACDFVKCSSNDREDNKNVHFEFVGHINETPLMQLKLI